MVNFRKLLLIVVISSSFTAPGVSYAEFWYGQSLVEWARSYDRVINDANFTVSDLSNQSMILGYVTGINDGLEGLIICTPQQVTAGQLVSIVEKYLRDNPDKWNQVASIIVKDALVSAFPCKQ